MPPDAATLLTFFKALADETRLKIVGLLANTPHSGDELAAMLAVSPPTISHHLTRLQEANLVEARAEQHYHVYSLRFDVLQALARDLLSSETLSATVDNVDRDAFSKKVLHDYLVRGRLKTIPSQLKKKRVVVGWLAEQFTPGTRYSEKEVNEVLKKYHDDFASLRRDLIDMKFFERKDGRYWRFGT